jgi:hypothetical protein
MTRERAKELAPIIQAYGEGKVCEWQMSNGSWSETAVLECMDGRNYRIKPEPKTRPMTRGEVLYMVTTTPAMVVRYRSTEPSLPAYFDYDDTLDGYEYAIIDKHGEPIGGWHKFEVEE